MQAAGLACVVGADDIRVVQSSDGPHLSLEPRHGAAIFHQAGVEHFERHGLVELGVKGPVDDAHAPLAQRLQQLVITHSTNAGLLNASFHVRRRSFQRVIDH